jgi:hypothetical protein
MMGDENAPVATAMPGVDFSKEQAGFFQSTQAQTGMW